MSLKILIADDEQEARELMRYYLQGPCPSSTLFEATNGMEAQKLLLHFQPDILFLDIKMPERSGLDILQNQLQNQLPAIVVTTAYDAYALPAFEYEVVDFLLKPFGKERFERALKRAIDFLEYSKLKGSPPFIQHITIRNGHKTLFIPVADIYYFEAEGAYVQIVTRHQSYLTADPIYRLESLLDPGIFLRIHRSVIVNTKFVTAIQSLPNGDHLLTLADQKEVRASRTYKDKIRLIKKK